MALPQFLEQGDLDYIVFDYLAEITMSILARAKSANPELGYATDFVSAVVKPYAAAISASGAKLISNAGGLNPEACAAAIRAVAEEAGVELRVAVVVGDDLMSSLRESVPADAKEMFSGDRLPPREAIASANAYLGAFPIAQALATDADIILTGRCVDSAVTLGACIHAFGWTPKDLDLLAAGSLVGHLLECGPQVTGGNYTDWEAVADGLWDIGYPIAEVRADGTAVITKSEGRGGAVTLGTVGEQLLYEIGDPAQYVLPDVVCDFTQVTLTNLSKDAVAVSGARGRGIPKDYKLSMTWMDGWRAGAVFFYAGQDAAKKARLFAASALRRARAKLESMGLGDYDEVAVEVVGDESQYGAQSENVRPREVAIKVACRHQQKAAVALLMRELTGVALAAPAGLFSFAGTRPKPSPVVRLFSTLVPKDVVEVTVIADAGDAAPVTVEPGLSELLPSQRAQVPMAQPTAGLSMVTVPLSRLAWARSGDKGNKANIGIMARQPEYLAWITVALTPDEIRRRFAHFMERPELDCFYLPGISAINVLIHDALGGGGVASLRNDPQAKAYAQLLLDAPIPVPANLLES
jgi:hypothetical protein